MLLQNWFKPLLAIFYLAANSYLLEAQVVDQSFISPFNSSSFIREIAVQSDSKIIVAGRLYAPSLNGGALVHLARLQSDGSIDPGFTPGILPRGDIYAIKTLSNGKIIIGGYFPSYNNKIAANLVMLNADGSIDNTFNIGSGLNGTYDYIKDIYLLSNQKILIGGTVTKYNGTDCNLLVRLNADGSLDQSFRPGADYTGRIETIEVQSDGKILIGGGIVKKNDALGRQVLIRLNEDGSLDNGFVISKSDIPSINRLVVQPDGKILVGGDFSKYNDTAYSSLVRLNSNGSIDKSLVTGTGFKAIHGGIITYPLNIVADIKLQQNGNIIVSGNFYEYNQTFVNGIIKLNADGSISETYQACKRDYSLNGGTIYGLSLLPNDQLLAVGSFFQYFNSNNATAVMRLNASPGAIPLVTANFDYIVQGLEMIVQNKSANAKSYYWYFGTYPASELSNPTHTYTYPGNYTVELYTYGACGTQNVMTKQVSIVNLKSLYPNKGGNTGTVTVKIAGAGFTDKSTVSLVQGSKEIKGINIVRSPDGNFVNVTFELYNATTGPYDLVVATGASKQTLQNGFTVTQGNKPVIKTSISGRDAVRIGAPQTYTFVVSNEGNIDAKGMILWIALPRGTGFSPVNFTMVGRKEDSVMLEDGPPMYFTVDSLFDGPDSADVLGMIVRNIPAHGTVNFEANLSLKQAGHIYAWTSSPMYGSPKNEESTVCQDALNGLYALSYEIVKEGIEQISEIVRAGIECGEAAYDLGTEFWFYSNNLFSDDLIEWRKVGEHYEIREYQGERKPISPNSLEQWDHDRMLNNGYTVSILPILGKAAWDCFGLVGLKGRGYKVRAAWRKLMKNLGSNASGAKKVVHTVIRAVEKSFNEKEVDILTIKDVYDIFAVRIEYAELFKQAGVAAWNAGACIDWLRKGTEAAKFVNAITSLDPNEKTGPPGNAESHFSQAVSPFNYRIYFENKNTATAPAQEVRIIDTLDKSVFDLNTFELESFKLGNAPQVLIPGGLKAYSCPMTLKRPGKPDLLVRMDAKLDTASGVLTFRFISLDPVTKELIDDPLDGFLPPNKQSPEGEGFVAYKVLPKSSLPDGANITNQALIYFDNNEPIYTNTYLNKVDKSKPVSKIKPLPTTATDSTFNLTWEGHDAGSGIRNYNIYYAVNKGPYTIWQFDAASTSAAFTGRKDSTYHFYSIAKDYAGNIENSKAQAEASILVTGKVTGINDPPGDGFYIRSYPNPAATTTWLEFSLPQPQPVRIVIRDLQGKEIGAIANRLFTTGTHKLEWDVRRLPAGMYILEFNSKKFRKSLKLVKQ